jgi:hypothetical protein
MTAFKVRRGRRYRAIIALGLIEQWADNETIAAKLRTAGFCEVKVTGTGNSRLAEALWTGPDTAGEMPPQVCKVSEISSRTRRRSRARRKA